MDKAKNPTVSVIIPTYNRAYLVGRAIKSILNQTYLDFEIIIIDDGSEDNTDEVVNNFSDNRIRYIKLEKNTGAAAARNRGINEAKGDFIAFQDSDNEWLPEKLKKQMDIFEKLPSNIGVLYSKVLRIKGDEKTLIPSDKIMKKEGDLYEDLIKKNFIDLPTAIVRKECLEKIGLFDESLPRLQDWELWIKISNKYHFKYIDEPLVNAYHMKDSLTGSPKFYCIALEIILDRHLDDFKKYRKILARYYIDLGHNLFYLGYKEKARKYLLKAFITYPLNLMSLFVYIITFTGIDMYNKIYKIYRSKSY